MVIVGPSEAGKTAFVRRHSHGSFSEDYTPSTDVRSVDLKFNTSVGEITFKVWDIPDRIESSDIYYENADYLLAFYSVHSKQSRDRALFIANQRKAVFPKMHVVLCGNKVDDRTTNQYLNGDIDLILPVGYSFCYLSAKTAYGIERPFLMALNAVAKLGAVTFIESNKGLTAVTPTERTLYEVPFSDKMLQHCLALMTALPRQIDVEKTGPNMVSMTGKGSDTATPELFQVIQEQDGTYSYQHLECGTSKVIGHLVDVDPSHFVFPHKSRATSIEVREGVDTINLYPSLMRGKVVSNLQKRVYFLGAENGYDGFGEPLRDDFECTFCEMGEKGYSAIIEVFVSYYKEDA